MCLYSSMETVTRKLQKILGNSGSRWQHRMEEENGGYSLLSDMIMPEKRSKKTKQSRVAREYGCFGVCVGAERQRFVVKIEHANHPLFMALLEDAENEYGKSIHNDGPIYIPCDVDVFCETMAEIIIADFDSSVSDGATSSYRLLNTVGLAGFSRFRGLFKFDLKLNHML